MDFYFYFFCHLFCIHIFQFLKVGEFFLPPGTQRWKKTLVLKGLKVGVVGLNSSTFSHVVFNCRSEFSLKIFKKCLRIDDFDVGNTRYQDVLIDFDGVSVNMDRFSQIFVEISSIFDDFSTPTRPCVTLMWGADGDSDGFGWGPQAAHRGGHGVHLPEPIRWHSSATSAPRPPVDTLCGLLFTSLRTL